MKKIVSFCYVGLVLSLVLIQGVAQAAKPPYQATSPDGKTRMELTVNDQKQLVYRVTFEGNPVVDWSALGFPLTNLAVGENAVITKQTRRTNKEQVAWPLGEKDIIQNNYQELMLDCRSRGLHYKITARVFDGSVAFRYVLPQQKGKEVIPEERTIFTLTDAYTIYQYNEESVFTPVAINSLDKTCDFPATLTNGKFFISLGEASNDSYTKAVLAKGPAANSLAVAFLKDSVTTFADFQTPWRTISIATSAIGLHQFSDLPLRLTPPVKEVSSWIKPGKLIRSSLTTQAGLDCIDFAAKHDFQYILFDAGWYGAEFRGSSDPTKPIPAIDMAKVIQHGRDKNIGVILYVNRVGLRAKLDTILPLYKKWGVTGLKFGFVDGLSQEGISWLAGAIKKVYDYGFILDIHDNYKPTGLSRSFPNLLTQEGIRGNENNPDAYHNTVLPFTRFLAGAADYTFCFPNSNRFFNDNLYKTKLQVSKGQQLALSVVYFSPLQAIFWYGNPNDYNDDQETEFFKRVPTVWNETHYLTGDIGKYISVARRKGTSWYVGSVAGLSDWEDAVQFDFLTKGKSYIATIYEDDAAGGIHKRTVTLKQGDTFPIRLRAKGGQAIVIDEH